MMSHMKISNSDALNYLRRWLLASAAEIAELRTTPMEIKLRQLASMMASHSLFDDAAMREKEDLELRARWARIRRKLDD